MTTNLANQLSRINLANGGSMQSAQVVTLKSGQTSWTTDAKRRIGPERWQRVNIEFEFESRNFRDHGHSTSACDVIVCWWHNWEAYPENIEVVEL